MEACAPTPLCIDSPAPETTFALGALLGRAIGVKGLAIGLIGPLGSGKTLFVKGLAEGLGLDPSLVSSPTFVIAQQYPLREGPETLHHLDLYRLESRDELEALGLRDWLAPGQVIAVEWLDRFPEVLGAERLEVVFLPWAEAPAGNAAGSAEDAGSLPVGRRIRVMAWGDEPARVLQDLAERWARREQAQREEAQQEQEEARGAGPAAAAKQILALLAVGWLGIETWGGVPFAWIAPEARGVFAPACRALAPEPALERASDAVGDADASGRRDALGPLRVVCVSAPTVEARGDGAAAGELEGMARLLDGGRVDPNDASLRLLESLPGIGPGRAAAIDEARRHAPFRHLSELERVPGIGPKTRAKLEAWLAVDSETPSG